MRVSSNQIQINMLDNLQQGFREYGRLDRQIATGKRILQPSDDPIGSVRLLGLQKEQASMEQYQKNIFNAKTQLSQAEVQLDSMTNLLMRARDLTELAATGSLTYEDRQGVAQELASLRDGLLDFANARNEAGSSLFAGSQVDKKTLVKDAATGSYLYQGDSLAREVAVGKGVMVTVNETADRLFTAHGDYFKQLDDFIKVLETETGSVNAQAGAMLDRSKVLQDDIGAMQGRIGARVNLLDQVDSAHTEMKTYSKEVSNQIASLDYAEAATQQSHVLMALQVQQQAFAKINSLSLFNYIP
ncbi:flagellar hook-associated protein FlgL [Aeromonas diversa]|uniref:Lateral flagellar hook-associated protein, LfgL n=1 Tax=Aeromonas diversa CDC 2478-85 TaxID=1268237 RepID=N9TZ56_9GAMM|nr:flagellar hook-associated protein FlgL [Aeromonas diversa]ENY71404.1 lateral flagellar hook-associated protein, LfgL [Aeromonas diversa CDC 2478-85]